MKAHKCNVLGRTVVKSGPLAYWKERFDPYNTTHWAGVEVYLSYHYGRVYVNTQTYGTKNYLDMSQMPLSTAYERANLSDKCKLILEMAKVAFRRDVKTGAAPNGQKFVQ